MHAPITMDIGDRTFHSDFNRKNIFSIFIFTFNCLNVHVHVVWDFRQAQCVPLKVFICPTSSNKVYTCPRDE